MRLLTKLDAPYRYTVEKIMQPSVSDPLEWREVRALFREIGDARWEANGDFKVTRNGHVLILKPSIARKISGPDEILELRRFLERSDEIPPLLDPAAPESREPSLVKTPS